MALKCERLKRQVSYLTAILHSTQVPCQTGNKNYPHNTLSEENVCKGGKKDVWSINGGEMDRGCRKNRASLFALYGSPNFFFGIASLLDLCLRLKARGERWVCPLSPSW